MKRSTAQHWTRATAASVLILILTAGAIGHGMIPHNAPVDRLVINLEKYVNEHPEDPEALYRLGRVHLLALESKDGFVLVFGQEGEERPTEGSWSHRREWDKPENPQPSSKEALRNHLSEAVTRLNKAIQMRPDEAKYRLTLACALEAGQSMIDDVDVWPLAPVENILTPLQEKEWESFTSFADRAFAEAAKNQSVFDDYVRLMREAAVQRDIIMTAAYKHRNDAGCADVIAKLRRLDWKDQIEDQYFAAMCYSLPIDGKRSEKPIWGGMEDWVSYEAGKDFIRVVEARDSRPEDTIRLNVAKDTIAAFDNLPRPGAITPIIIDFDGRFLASLTTTRPIAFNLDGTGRPQQWTWVTPDAGILVWDPEHTGRITSGHQLFGSVSWFTFFDNGYQALDALDDNRDGELSSAELKGIAVWFDRNTNGVSDLGEVVPIEDLPVTAISCRAISVEDDCPANQFGLRLADGSTRPTYDWIAKTPPEAPMLQTRGVATAWFFVILLPLGIFMRR